MPKPLIVTADQAPAPLKVIGEEITVLLPASATGSFEIFRQVGPEGNGPPPHSHPWDEAFYVLEGEVIFGVDTEQDIVASTGTLVHVPGGSTHWFRFGSGGGTMLSMTSGAGAAEFFTEVAHQVSPTAPDMDALVGVATSHGLSFPIPAS
ncbi:MAG: cupin [Acidimicrobiaceae bacterium]|nr:cupin [Acidimicrobiaceae bacterium]